MNFDEAKACLCKAADIPEVEAVIRLLSRFARREWQREMEEALRELELRLGALSDRLGAATVDDIVGTSGDRREDLITSILAGLMLILERRASSMFGDARSGAMLREAVTSLERSGAEAVSLTAAGSSIGALAAFELLRTLMVGRFRTRSAEIQTLLREFLVNRRARTAQVAEGAAVESAGRAGWLARLRDALGLVDMAWITDVVDIWAYRQFNVGSIEAGAAVGRSHFRMEAVLDSKTSAFCRWVNGRVVTTEKLQRVLAAQQTAALDNDLGRLTTAWAFVPIGVAKYGSAEQFAALWPSLGLPPFHFRCRTRAVPVQI